MVSHYHTQEALNSFKEAYPEHANNIESIEEQASVYYRAFIIYLKNYAGAYRCDVEMGWSLGEWKKQW